MNHWLFKTEPDVFSIQDLAKAPRKTTFWDGVRNYQARNLLRDGVKKGDRVLIYHSNADPMGIAGTAVVVKEAWPDPTAFEKGHIHYDPKSKKDAPAWVVVDVRHERTFSRVITREDLAGHPVTAGMGVLKRGNRLSIQPVTRAEWDQVLGFLGK